jgi:hypothetical protein
MYTLQPLELACDGPQVLQIQMPKVRPFGRSGGGGLMTVENIEYYYLELRTPRGFDDTIRTSPTVLVHVAEDFRDRMDRGRHTWILDMDPSTRTIDGLGAGKSYTDPAGGVSFKVVALSQDAATIEVTMPNGTGPATCLDDATYDPAVPRLCGGLVGTPGSGITGAAGGQAPSGAAGAGATADTGSAGNRPPRVEAFVLVDADTDMDIMTVDDAAVLDLDQLPPRLTMRVVTDPPMVGSVVFRIDGGAPRTESIAPYSVSSDDGRGNFAPWMLGVGAHTVNATPFDAADGGGRQGEPFEIDFTLTRGGVSVPGGDVNASQGAAGVGATGLAGAGAGTRTNGVTGASGTTALFNPTAVPAESGLPLQNQAQSGCSCRTLGAGGGASDTPRSWALGLLLSVLAVGRLRRRASTRAHAD